MLGFRASLSVIVYFYGSFYFRPLFIHCMSLFIYLFAFQILFAFNLETDNLLLKSTNTAIKKPHYPLCCFKFIYGIVFVLLLYLKMQYILQLAIILKGIYF